MRELKTRMHWLAESLRVTEVGVAELRAHAERKGHDRRLQRLVSLVGEGGDARAF
jgi:hypothetical protein